MRRRHSGLTRREFVGVTVGAAGLATPDVEAAPGKLAEEVTTCALIINGERHDLRIEPRVTLLDLLREHLHLTGTKKGCDHGQCGACTVLADNCRILSCLTLAITQDGKQITTIEGLCSGEALHPMQAAFIEQDGLQCGFCTPGQICSAIAMLNEARAGMPSSVTFARPGATRRDPRAPLDADEIRERMSGNICRCGAYPNIVSAIQAVERMPPES
jgi:xanthine dehydrogenase YagT iron-sulfur-binding subunit